MRSEQKLVGTAGWFFKFHKPTRRIADLHQQQ